MADDSNVQKNLERTQQRLQLEQQINAAERESLKNTRALSSDLEEQRKIWQKQLDIEGKIASGLRSQEQTAAKLVEHAKTKLAELRAEASLDHDKIKNMQDLLATNKAIASIKKDELATIEQTLATQRKAISHIEIIHSKTKGLITTLTGIDSAWKDTFLGSIINASRETGNFKHVLSQTFAAMNEATSFGNVFGSTAMKIVESTTAMVSALDSATVAFRKATGAGKEYTSSINTVFENTRRFGVGLEQSAQAFQKLFSGMSGFTGYSSGFRENLAGISAMLEKVGISGDTFAKNFDTMTKSFGMSAGQARQLSMDVSELGRTIGIPPSQLASALSTLAPRLAMFGGLAETELRKLAAQSKATGLEMQKLQGIAKGFDTFSDAAQRVGQLNALLGGPYLNTIQMMMATDTERNAILKRVISTTGMMGDMMSGTTAKARMFKKALADIGGFGGDVDTMMRILSSNLNEFSSDAMRATGSLNKLQQEAMNNTSIQEKLLLVFTRFSFQLEGILKIIHPLLDGLANIADALGGWFIPALLATMGAIKMVMIPLGAFFASIASGSAAVGGLTAGVGGLTAGVSGLTAGAAAVAIPIAAFGAAIALVGGGIWAAAQGVSTMAQAFKTMDEIDISKIVSNVGSMVGQITSLGNASENAYSAIGGIGQSMRVITMNVGPATTGMIDFNTAMSIFASATAGKVTAFESFNNELYRMVSGITRLVSLSQDLRTLPISNISTMGTSLNNLASSFSGASMESAVNNLFSMSRAAEQIARTTKQIDTSKTNVMQQVAMGIKATVQAAVDLSAVPEAIDATNRIAAAASRYARAVSESRNLHDPLKGLIETIRSSMGANTGGGGGGGGGGRSGTSNIVMKMNDRVFATAVVDVLKSGEFNLVQG